MLMAYREKSLLQLLNQFLNERTKHLSIKLSADDPLAGIKLLARGSVCKDAGRDYPVVSFNACSASAILGSAND